MEKLELIERAKMYIKLLSEGVHPVTGQEIPEDSAFMDEKVKRCFDFISQVLDEYVELSETDVPKVGEFAFSYVEVN